MAKTTTPTTAKDGRRHKVLVVDDVEYVQLMYKQAFAEPG